MSMQSLLAWHIKQHGPIKTARVSSAQARGAAKQYAYYGVVRYQIQLRADGVPTNVARGRASSDRRSLRLAQQDLEALCEREGREECQAIGPIPEDACASWLPAEYADAIGRHNARQAKPTHAPTLRERLAEFKLSRFNARHPGWALARSTDRYFSGLVLRHGRNWSSWHVGSVAEAERIVAEREATERAEAARREEEYTRQVMACVPTGRVRFTAEGGFKEVS
jgi:hypothetical protein